ncbi:putative oxidoreductase YteT isoform X2 [Ahaetulla prasina]|uniref:putative oxidoreductase YteT isoform X2 n=1 Tax=Ahaetulla prasina TaxID=499056 RepID=UPI0026480360|nr:putative oxidoreductase YteT isoform X2 [Ahaetulla prasina]
MSRRITVLVIGAGNRGKNYSSYALCYPERMKVIGVADPRALVRQTLQDAHKIPAENVFGDWVAAAEREKLADAVIIATPDRLHKAPAVAFAQKGYHILLEKPMAVTAEDCKEVVRACESNHVILAVCHVLRYHPVTLKIKELLDAGLIGDICHIQHLEPIGFWHFAHSFVRGNWRNETESSFSLLAKSCHDFDLINFWMGSKRCLQVSSFGRLSHFTKEHKPEGAGARCLDCSIERNCPYSARKIYLERAEQVVNMEFEGGATAAFTMVAFTEKLGVRTTTIYGTKGELSCKGEGEDVEVFDFLQKKRFSFSSRTTPDIPACLNGHCGADYYLIHNFVSAVSENDPSRIPTSAEETLRSHLLVFAAEKARRENRVVVLETGRENSHSQPPHTHGK